MNDIYTHKQKHMNEGLSFSGSLDESSKYGFHLRI